MRVVLHVIRDKGQYKTLSGGAVFYVVVHIERSITLDRVLEVLGQSTEPPFVRQPDTATQARETHH